MLETLLEKMVLVTERFSRNGTRESSSWPGEKSPTRGRIHLRRLNFAHEISPRSRAADHTFSPNQGQPRRLTWINGKRPCDENHESKRASEGRDCHEPPTTIRTKGVCV